MPSSPISSCPSCPPHAARGHGYAVYSSSVTDAQWAILEPLSPAPGSTAGRGGRPEKHCRRAIVYAILYIVRGGIAWRQLPMEFPPAATMYAVFARWARVRRVAAHPRRAGRPTAGAGRAGPVPDRGDHRLADGARRRHRAPIRPRLGWRHENERRQAAHRRGCELLLTVVVTAASIPDRDAAHRLLAALRGSFSTIGLVWADGGYLGRLLIWAKDVLTVTMQIIKRIPGATGFHVRPRIWVVERSFAWINKHRRCARDYGYDSTLHSFDKAAGKLGIDAIDLLILHQALPGEFDLTIGAYKALERLYAHGRVRAIGVSNFMPRHLDRLLAETDVVPAINQIEVHPYFRQSELLPVDTEHGILNQAWAPIGGITFYREGPHTSTLENPVIGEIAAKHSKTPAQVMLRWHIQQGRQVIPKPVTPSRIEENSDSFDFDLTDEQLAAIDALDTGIRGCPEPEEITRENYAIEIPEA